MKHLFPALCGFLMVLQAACGGAAAPSSTAASGAPSTASSAKPAASAKPGLTPIELAYVAGSAVGEPLHLALAKGFFAEQRLDVKLATASGPARMASLISGEIQFVAMGSPELVEATHGGANPVMLATLADYPVFSLYGGKGIKTVEGLAGKVVGMGRVGADTDLAAQVFLAKYGLTDKTKLVAVGGSSPAIVAALQKGTIDAGVFAPPATAQAAKDGYVELINGPKLEIPWTHSGITTTRGYLKDHPDIVKRFLTAFQKSWTFSGNPANRSAVVADIAAASKIEDDVASVTYDYVFPVWAGKKVPTVDPRGIATAISLSKQSENKSLKPEDLIDNSIISSLSPA